MTDAEKQKRQIKETASEAEAPRRSTAKIHGYDRFVEKRTEQISRAMEVKKDTTPASETRERRLRRKRIAVLILVAAVSTIALTLSLIALLR